MKEKFINISKKIQKIEDEIKFALIGTCIVMYPLVYEVGKGSFVDMGYTNKGVIIRCAIAIFLLFYGTEKAGQFMFYLGNKIRLMIKRSGEKK